MSQRLFQRPAAAAYLGMSPRSFDVQVAPHLPYILVGRTGKRYDARDLDAWVDAQAKITPERGEKTPCSTPPASRSAAPSGTSTRRSASAATASNFVSQLAAARAARPKQSC